MWAYNLKSDLITRGVEVALLCYLSRRVIQEGEAGHILDM